MDTINKLAAIQAQKDYLKSIAEEYKNDFMHSAFLSGCGFAPSDGKCYRCNNNIYENTSTTSGYSVERASREMITGCPHCHYSFVS